MGVEDLRVNQLEWSVADVKQAIKLLTQLALKADERLESLVAAQLRTEEAIQKLSTVLEALTGGIGPERTASASLQPNTHAPARSSDE